MAFAYKKGKSIFIGYKDAHGHPVREKSTATTITEGRRLALEMEQRAERIRRGLEAPPPPPTSFAALAKRYLEEVASQRRDRVNVESRLRVHLEPEFAPRLLTQIRPGDIEGFLARKAAVRKPQTVAHLRQLLHGIFAFAIRAELLQGENPVDKVPKPRIPEREIRYLAPEIVPKVIGAVPRRWRNLFATAVLVGARRGELFALRTVDVDLSNRVMTFARSNEGATTKGGKVRVVPIPDELVPFLQDALSRARGGLVFPASNGKMLSKHTDMAEMLRRALVAAGVVERWELKCRRQGCGHVEESPTKRSFPCPKPGADGKPCGFALWPVAVAPPLQFKDLRSTWATLAGEATGDIRFVQVGLGHRDSRTTEKHYAAVRARHMLEQANKLKLGLEPPTSPATHPALTGIAGGEKKEPEAPENLQESPALTSAGWTGLEPAPFGVTGHSTVSPGLVGSGFLNESAAGAVLAFAPLERVSPLPTHPALTSSAPLLTVAAVAKRLGVCEATVYGLVNRGELAHTRLLNNAIRLAPADLEAFLAARRSGGRR